MARNKKLLSTILSCSLTLATWPIDACKKSEPPVTRSAPEQAEQQAPATTYAVPTADQLYQLVAPVALFPDNLIAQVLAASTYPDEVTAASTWLRQNSSLKDGQLTQAIDQQDWDASVKGLTQFPDVLNQMASNLSWTSALGDAYFNVPQDVMNAVQVMRQRAEQAGNLKSNQEQTVSVQNQAPGTAPPPVSPGAPGPASPPEPAVVQAPPQTIIIEPAQPDVVYVPTYNPTLVYGDPVPVYPGYSSADLAVVGAVSFGVGIAVGAVLSGGGGCCGWGWNSWGCGWHNSTLIYNNNTYISRSNTFVNRNNYYNRNFNSANFNRNNINRNNLNYNNNRVNNYRANNFNNTAPNTNFTTPKFDQKYNQPQFNNNRGNLAQNTRPGGSNRSNLNQQNRPNFDQNQGRAANLSQGRPANLAQNRPNNRNQNRPANLDQERGFGQQANRGTSSGAFSNFSSGGNARVNSARGQQSLAQNRPQMGGGFGQNRAASFGGNRGGSGGNRGGGGQLQARAGGGGRRR
jgi:Protein of unknown function (DUF3300)